MSADDGERVDRVIDRSKQTALPGTLVDDLRLIDVANAVGIEDLGVATSHPSKTEAPIMSNPIRLTCLTVVNLGLPFAPRSRVEGNRPDRDSLVHSTAS